MIEFIKKNKKYILIGLIVLLIIIGLVFIFGKKNIREAKDNDSNVYKFAKSTDNGVEVAHYSTDSMKSEHCLDGVCVSGVEFYYVDDRGKIDYTITNKNSSKVSGYLKADFGFTSITIPYNDLEPNKTYEKSSYYDNVRFDFVDDYKLLALTDQEKSKIIVEK